PDGRWLAYARLERSWNKTICLYDLRRGRRIALTPPETDANSPAFDPGGRALYFLFGHLFIPKRINLIDFFGCERLGRVARLPMPDAEGLPLVPAGGGPAASASGIASRIVDLTFTSASGRALVLDDYYTRLEAGDGRLFVHSGGALDGGRLHALDLAKRD